MDDVELGIQAPSHAGAASDQVLAGRIRTDANGQSFAYRPVFFDVLGSHVRFQAAIDVFSDLAQGKFAQSDQIAAPKKIVPRRIAFVFGINTPAFNALL